MKQQIRTMVPGSCKIIRVVPKAAIFYFLLRSLVLVAPICFVRSEGRAIITTGINIVLFGTLLLLLIFLFRRYYFHLNEKYGFRLIYISILFCISFFFYFLRIYLVSRLGSFYSDSLYSGLLILCASGGEILPYSGPSSSSSWTEDSFEMRVLLEPFSETEMEGTSVNPTSVARDEAGPSHQPSIMQNLSLEASLNNRILRLERDHTPFLLDKEKGAYWNNIKIALDQAPSQKEYNRLLDFENRDLQIREQKHQAYSLFQDLLAQHPVLAKNAAYNPEEAFVDFVTAKRDELDQQGGDVVVRDQRELTFLEDVYGDIRESGRNSIYIKTILGIP